MQDMLYVWPDCRWSWCCRKMEVAKEPP